eukprot:GHVU01053059.1.p1 GENE.GHVU01053059.1~~GHVU01053059.1.p1  ORF type:complete len:273 (-),score=26.56 GHVU01053059.1:305-1123(-)
MRGDRQYQASGERLHAGPSGLRGCRSDNTYPSRCCHRRPRQQLWCSVSSSSSSSPASCLWRGLGVCCCLFLVVTLPPSHAYRDFTQCFGTPVVAAATPLRLHLLRWGCKRASPTRRQATIVMDFSRKNFTDTEIAIRHAREIRDLNVEQEMRKRRWHRKKREINKELRLKSQRRHKEQRRLRANWKKRTADFLFDMSLVNPDEIAAVEARAKLEGYSSRGGGPDSDAGGRGREGSRRTSEYLSERSSTGSGSGGPGGMPPGPDRPRGHRRQL